MMHFYRSYVSISKTNGANNAEKIFREDEIIIGPSRCLTAGDRLETADNGFNMAAARKARNAITATTAHLELAKEKVKERKVKAKEKIKAKAKIKVKEKTKARKEKERVINRGTNLLRTKGRALIGTKANAPKATAATSNITLLAAFSQPLVVAARAVNASFSMLAKPRLPYQLPPLRPRPLLVDGRVEEDLLAQTRIKQSPHPSLYACGS